VSLEDGRRKTVDRGLKTVATTEVMICHGMKSQAGAWRSEEQEMPHARARTPSSPEGARKICELKDRGIGEFEEAKTKAFVR